MWVDNMDYNELAKIFQAEGLSNAEITFYTKGPVKNTIRFDLSQDDYQWSISSQPIKTD